MPIVDGKYEAQIMTYYKSIEEAMEEIRDNLKRTRKVRVSNLPFPLLKELMPLLEGKDLAVILPEGAEPWPELTALCEVARTKSRIFVVYKGVEALVGNIVLPDVQFSIIWDKDKVLEITAMNYSSCVKCQRKTFDMSWRYSEKLGKKAKKA
jgi:hypothetical protein